jgi:hypothetical protein
VSDDAALLNEMFAAHVDVARRVGSTFYEGLLEHMREDAIAGGPVRIALLGHEHDPPDAWDAYRLLAGVHRLVLEGEAPELAARYPSVGGDGNADEAWPEVRHLIASGRAEIMEALKHPLQTNAISRAQALVGGMCILAAEFGLPLRILELGASAGLNLRLDRFRYEDGGAAFGPPDSPVRFADFLTGPGRPPLERGFEVVERAGCDLHPLDPTDPEDALTLRACIFPDETERFDRLAGALEVAAATPATVEQADLAAWVARQLAEPRTGVTTVVYHTIVWSYLPDEVRAAAEETIARAGDRATRDAPLGLLAFEGAADDASRAELRLTTWPGGEERLLATSSFHPKTVEWLT